MAKPTDRRQPMKDRILDAAEARIASDGAANLRARDVMADAGAALGGLYNAFADLDDVVLHVNSRTLARMRSALGEAVAGERDPGRALKALARAYLTFAQDHRSLWSALFEYPYASGRPMPNWHLAEQRDLLLHIVEPLRVLRPDWPDEMLFLRARTLFGAIHGIVSTSMADRFVGVGGDRLAIEIEDFVEVIVAGTNRIGP